MQFRKGCGDFVSIPMNGPGAPAVCASDFSNFIDRKQNQTVLVTMRPGYGRKENGKYKIPLGMLAAMKNEYKKSRRRRFIKWCSFFPRIFDIHDHFGLIQPAQLSWDGAILNSYRGTR